MFDTGTQNNGRLLASDGYSTKQDNVTSPSRNNESRFGGPALASNAKMVGQSDVRKD